ncbi:MAG TPA: DinB family protein, partial [Candidatus Dormibacteraeota bacterium]
MHPVLALFRRNSWAGDRLLEFCNGRPETALPAESDVYGSIDSLFNHIVRSEAGYLRLVTGKVPKDRVLVSEPRPLGELGAPAQLLAEHWEETLQTERDPEAVLPFQRGEDLELMPDWLPLVQTVHHGDDHRTQIATLLGRHGIEAPDLDGWSFGESTSQPADEKPREWWA